MAKIKVKNPVVELDGDEMTRIIWKQIREQLILPYLDVDLEYYDLGIEHRDATDDQVTVDSANAIKRHGVGVKCATITPDEARVEEFGLKKMWRSPNGTIRNILGGVVFREPIVMSERAAARARLDQADRDRPSRARRPVQGDRLRGARPGQGHHHVHAGRRRRADGAHRRRFRRWRRRDGHVQLRRLDPRLRPRLAALRPRPQVAGLPVDEEHDPEGVRRPLQGHLRRGLRGRVRRADFKAAGITYEHRLIDDMVAAALKWEGGFVWACKNYDGDVQSDTVAQGFGSLGLMTSVLMTPGRQDV